MPFWPVISQSILISHISGRQEQLEAPAGCPGLFIYKKKLFHPDQRDLPAQNSGPPEWSRTVFSLLL